MKRFPKSPSAAKNLYEVLITCTRGTSNTSCQVPSTKIHTKSSSLSMQPTGFNRHVSMNQMHQLGSTRYSTTESPVIHCSQSLGLGQRIGTTFSNPSPWYGIQSPYSTSQPPPMIQDISNHGHNHSSDARDSIPRRVSPPLQAFPGPTAKVPS